MTAQGEARRAGEALSGSAGSGDLLSEIHQNSVTSIELLQTLVGLLLPRAEPRSGPTLDELLAAIVAMQRDQMVLLRHVDAELGVLLDHLAGSPLEERNRTRTPSGRNGEHEA